MLPDIVALYSSSMGHGKTAASNYLRDIHGYVPVKFAGTIKAMISSFLIDFGIQADDLPLYLEGPRKEQPVEARDGSLLNMSTRQLMQTLGTDWGRALVNRQIWVAITVNKIKRLLEDGKKVVVDDMRFDNEYDTLRDLGALMVMVKRPHIQVPNVHLSEGLLDHRGFHHKINNDSDLGHLYGDLERVIELAA